MSDIGRKLINMLKDDLAEALNDKLRTHKSMESMVYRDEPIIKRLSDLPPKTPPKAPPRPEQKPAPVFWPSVPAPAAAPVAPALRKLRDLASSPAAFHMSREELFYHQALLMETYEEHLDFYPVSMHFTPTYQSLTNRELMGYFSWRARVRRGEFPQAPSDYYKLLIYETIHQIGVSSPEEGYHLLDTLSTRLSEADPLFSHDKERLLRDYAFYYHLVDHIPPMPEQKAFDEALSVIFHRGEHTEQELAEALNHLSTYRLENSRFCKEHYPETCVVIARFFGELSEYYAKHRKHSLETSLFGIRAATSYPLFRDMVFFDYLPHPDYEYQAGCYSVFSCRGHWWSFKAYQGHLRGNREVGILLKGVDRILREEYGDPHTLKDDGKLPRYAENMIRRIVAGLKKEALQKKEAEEKAPKPLSFDLSRLDSIRRSSDRTRDSLLIEEEIPENAVPAPVPEPVPAPPVMETPASPQDEGLPLSPVETEFLSCLLEGRPWQDLLKENGLMPSLVVDQINEKAFDFFGDTIILFDGDVPELIEDYIDELKSLL